MEPDEFEEAGIEMPEFHVITITINPEAHQPMIDLGDVPPHAALCFFRQAAMALEDILCPPTITFDGKIIYQVMED